MDDTSVQSRDPTPDVLTDSLVVFDAPDVRIEDFVRFERPDIRLENFTVFDTPKAYQKSRVREWSESLLTTIVFVLLFTGFVAQATQVPTESMKPTILVGDHFFLDKVAFPGNFPEFARPWLPRRSIGHGDIIAFRSPVDSKIPFVKRVIAVAGETLEIRHKVVFVNGKALDEPYKIHVDATLFDSDYGPVTVPDDSFFVMGDNRDNSNDSRFWGFVDRDSVIGKPLFVYWSYESDPYVAGERSWEEIGREYLSIARHFFTRTRWFRIGTIVK